MTFLIYYLFEYVYFKTNKYVYHALLKYVGCAVF